MATDVEKLVVELSAKIDKFDKALANAAGITNKQFNAIERRARQLNKNLDGILGNAFKGLAAPLAGIGAALGASEIIRLTDVWTDLNSRVNIAAGSTEKGTEVMGRLGDVARRTYSSLEQTAEGYLLNAKAMQELGYSTNQTLDYTEAVNNALVISGAKGQRAASVMDALSKAMALGKLSGDNLNTVIATGGRLAEALAQGLGVGVNELRALGTQGKITGRDIVRALSGQMEKLRQEAVAMPATISDGVQLLKNALLEYVGNADMATGVSAKISEALVIMADNFDKTADVALQLAAVIAGALIGRSLGGMIKTLGLAGTALVNFTRAIVAARTMASLATSFGGLAASAGPVGVVIGGAVVASLVLYSSATADASEGAKRFADRLDEISKRAENSAEKVEAAGQRYNEALKNSIGNEVKAATKELDDTRQSAVNLLGAFAEIQAMSLVTEEQYKELARLRDGINNGDIAAEDAKQSLFRMANEDYNFQEVADAISPILDRLALVVKGAKDATAELAAISGAEFGGPTFRRGGAGNARRDLEATRGEARQYEAEQLRRAALGKDQLALENEIARVKKQSLDDGKKLTDDQIKRVAEANLAGNAARSGEGKKPSNERADEYQRLAERIVESTAAMIAETEVQRQLNPLIDDYGYAVERARAEQELLNAAQKAGKEVTPQLRAEIAGLADQYALATVEAAKLNEAQDKIRQSAADAAEFNKDLLRGMVDGFLQGKKAADIFADAISKLGNKLLDLAFDGLFDVKSGGAMLGRTFNLYLRRAA